MTSRFNRPEWRDRSVVIIASGPSLTDAQLHAVGRAHAQHQVRVIGVSDTYRRAPWVDVVFASDLHWWNKHIDAVRRGTPAERWTCDNVAGRQHQLNRISAAGRPGIGVQQLHVNGNSGSMAINLAALWGAAHLVLVGFDFKPGPDGRKHWFGAHPKGFNQAMPFDEWLGAMPRIAADCEHHGITVHNATEDTAIEAFPLVDLADALRYAASRRRRRVIDSSLETLP